MRAAVRLGVVTALVGGGVTLAAYQLDGTGHASQVLGPGTVEVVLDVEYSRFVPQHLTVHQGTFVRFVVRNHDPILHELIVGPTEVHQRHAGGHEARHPAVPGEVSVEPNATAETIYDFDQPGTVIFACHLPGHYEYGMSGSVEVVAS